MTNMIHANTEQLALSIAGILLAWQKAFDRDDLTSCRQLEDELFECVETNGLSQEWLALFAQLAEVDMQEWTSHL